MGTNKDPSSETKQVQEVTENLTGPRSRISPKLSREEIQASLKPLEKEKKKNSEMTRRDPGKAWESSLSCVHQVNILLHVHLAIRKKELCKHVSFYSPWYFPFVFLERFPSLQSHYGCYLKT